MGTRGSFHDIDSEGRSAMRIAITGGTGFVGSHLARALISSRHEVVLIARGLDDRDGSVRDLPDTRFFASDLSNVEGLARAFSGCGPP